MSKNVSLLLSLVLGAVLGFALSRIVPLVGGRALDPAAVAPRASEILNGSDPLRRIAEFGALLEHLGPEAVPAVTEAFDAAPLEVGDPEVIVFATWRASLDPQAAFEWTRTDWRAGDGAVIASVFRSWARRDPQEALQNVAKLRFPGQLDAAKDAIYAGWDESGQPGLADAFNKMSMRDQQRFAQILARRRVVALGVQEAIRWAESYPDPAMRLMMEVRVASAAATSKEGARQVSEWATPLIAAAKQPTGFPRRIGTRWVRHDPLAAMTWLASLPAGLDRDDGVTEAFRDWMMKDFPAATAWIKQQTQGELQPWAEPAIAVFAKTNGQARPEESLALAARFRDSELRDSTSAILLYHWIRSDRPTAEAWLAKSNISADVRKRVEVGLADPGSQVPGPGLPHGPLGPPEAER